MKKFLLAILVFIAADKLSAQNEYFQNNPSWVCFHVASPWPCELEDSIHYYITGDSIINSLTYKVLYKRGHKNEYSIALPNPGCNSNYTYQDTAPTGFLRSQGMQIYYIPDQDSVEYLLYDYNLTVGSHLPVTYLHTDTSYVVTSIDSIYTAAGYRQRYFLNGTNAEFLLEGIGSSAGLLYDVGPLFEQYAALICYSQDSTAWFPSQGPGCSIITSTPVQSQQEVSLHLLPNPATDYIQIIATGFSVEATTVYDVFGRVVVQTSNETKIFIGDLPSGVYTCVVSSGKTRVSKLLIVE